VDDFFVTVVGAIIAWMYDYNTLAIVLGVLSAFFAKAIYKFYKLGGRKATVGMNANDLIYKSKYKLGDTSGNERKMIQQVTEAGLTEYRKINENYKNLIAVLNESILAQITIYELQKVMALKMGVEIPEPKINMEHEEDEHKID